MHLFLLISSHVHGCEKQHANETDRHPCNQDTKIQSQMAFRTENNGSCALNLGGKTIRASFLEYSGGNDDRK